MEQYILPFVNVCERVFQEFCQTEVKSGQEYVVSKEEYVSNWDISGVIGLSGDATGAVAISLKEKTAFQITKNLTGKEHTHFDSSVTDAVGEIINIITGNVKKDFEEDMQIRISIPTIIKGRAHAIVWPSDKTKIICIPFSIFTDQEFCLSVAVDPTKQ